VYGESTTYSGTGVRGFNSIGDGVHGVSTGNSSAGVHGESSAGVGVHGVSTKSDGVWGLSTDGYGVHGKSSSVAGVYGESVGAGVFAVGVAGYSASGDGVRGQSSTGYGVYGYSSSSWAGYFQGNINVTGNCTGCAGPTRMDHPLDPENKYLYHSTVQSPDMKNVYDGNVTTDEYGEAVVVLPDYFEAFNRDFRYQLTVVGRFAQAIISQQVKDNRFTIKTDKPFVTVSWQVTGIRQDPYANAHRSPVEEDKPAGERGKYLHPTEWGQPESKGIDYEEQRRMQAVMKP
jgi:hypothetical protein